MSRSAFSAGVCFLGRWRLADEARMGRLTVKGLSKTYGDGAETGSVTALQNVSFEVPDNQFCSILGHSGCGKTTLLNIAAGFEKPSSGMVMVDDQPISAPGWKNTMIFQDYAL